MRRLVYSVGLLAIWWMGASLLAAVIASSETPQTETLITPESAQTAEAVRVLSPLRVTSVNIACTGHSIVSRLPDVLVWVWSGGNAPWAQAAVAARDLIYACLGDQYLQDQREIVGFTAGDTTSKRVSVGQQRR